MMTLVVIVTPCSMTVNYIFYTNWCTYCTGKVAGATSQQKAD